MNASGGVPSFCERDLFNFFLFSFVRVFRFHQEINSLLFYYIANCDWASDCRFNCFKSCCWQMEKLCIYL